MPLPTQGEKEMKECYRNSSNTQLCDGKTVDESRLSSECRVCAKWSGWE
jgi:hypothetical protein